MNDTISALLRADFEAVVRMDHVKPRGARRTFDVLTQAGFLAVVLFRIGHWLAERGIYPAARLAHLANVVLFGADIHPKATIGPGFVVAHPVGVAIGAGVVMGRDVSVFKGVSIGTAGMKDPARDGFPTIGDECKLFDGSKLFGPIEVGDRCRVGANVLLLRSIPPDSVVAQPPGQVIDLRAHTEVREGTS